MPDAGPAKAGKPPRTPKRAAWTRELPDDVVEAAQEVVSFWPDPAKGDKQPESETPVPGVAPPEVARRFLAIKAEGANLGICVEIARRAVAEYRAGKWIKAPQHWFGSSKDAPFQAYYQAHVTNLAMSDPVPA